jgi:hypothetical protein
MMETKTLKSAEYLNTLIVDRMTQTTDKETAEFLNTAHARVHEVINGLIETAVGQQAPTGIYVIEDRSGEEVKLEAFKDEKSAMERFGKLGEANNFANVEKLRFHALSLKD